jgi:hypothetical protein
MLTANPENIAPGMVVSSPRFRYGRTTNANLAELANDYLHGHPDRLPILVGLEREYNIDGLALESTCAGEGETPVGRTELHPSFLDRSSSTREFFYYIVVSVETRWRENWPNDPGTNGDDFGLCVTARRIADDGLWHPNGELIEFWMTGPFEEVIEEVKVFATVNLEIYVDKPSPLSIKDDQDALAGWR